MNALEFLSSVAWPLAVLVIAVMFRRPLTDALAAAGGRVKAGPFELEWDRGVSTVAEGLAVPSPVSPGGIGGAAGRMDELAEESPIAAVAEAYGGVEQMLKSLLEGQGVEIDEQANVLSLALAAHKRELLSDQSLEAIQGLNVLRNLAVHGGKDNLSTDRAHEFVALAQAVMYAISTRA